MIQSSEMCTTCLTSNKLLLSASFSSSVCIYNFGIKMAGELYCHMPLSNSTLYNMRLLIWWPLWQPYDKLWWPIAFFHELQEWSKAGAFWPLNFHLLLRARWKLVRLCQKLPLVTFAKSNHGHNIKTHQLPLLKATGILKNTRYWWLCCII